MTPEKKTLKEQQIANLPSANKARSDGSAYFKLVGGDMDGATVRSYAPFEDIPFSFGRYEYLPEPIGRRSKAHVYVFKPSS